MDARTFVLLAKLIALAADDLPPAGQSIVFLGRADDRTILDEASLLDAVAIYTRDLGVAVLRSAGRRPALSGASSAEEVATLLRSRNARLAFWCRTSADGRAFELLIADTRRNISRYAFPLEGPPGPELYRSVALTLRATLTGPEAPAPVASPPIVRNEKEALPPSPAPHPPPTVTVPGNAGTSAPPPPIASAPSNGTTGLEPSPPGPGASASESRPAARSNEAAPNPPPTQPPTAAAQPEATLLLREPPQPPYPFFLAVDYAFSLPSGSAPWRNAGALHAIASLGQAAEVDLGVELAAAGDQTVGGSSLSVLDIPVRLGARLVRRTSSYLVAAGALAGVHAFFVKATAAAPGSRTESTSTRTLAAAVGVEVLARGPSVYGFAPELRIFGEANLPNTRFDVAEVKVREEGQVTVGFGLGVALPAR